MSQLIYFDEIKKSMEWVSAQPNVIFLGQAVNVPGTFMFNTLKDIPSEQRLEMPVSESFQMQLSIGLSMSGYVPVSIYPRLNFLTLALGDLSNVVDKMSEFSPKKYPKIIIRSAVGPDFPVHPGHQHVGDFTEAFNKLFSNIEVIKLEESNQIMPAYQKALDPNNKNSSLIIEVGNYYNSK